MKKIQSSNKTNYYKVKANPTIFEKGGIDGDKSISNESSGTKKYVLVVPDTENLLMIELDSEKKLENTKELDTNKDPSTSKELTTRKEYKITNGELFIRYDKDKNTLFYLENLPK